MPTTRLSLLVLALPVATALALSGCEGARLRIFDFRPPDFEVSVSTDPEPFAFQLSEEAATQPTPTEPGTVATPTARSQPQEASSNLVREAIDACAANALHRGEIDWGQIRARAESMSGEGKSADEVIRWVVSELRDGHSSYLSAAEAAAIAQAATEKQASAAPSAPPSMPPHIEPSGKLLVSKSGVKLGYLRVPYLIAMDEARTTGYATTLGTLQRELVDAGAQGWVVDLRRNVGGNQWPMLAALSRILGDGAHGAIVPPGGERVTWGTSSGASWMNAPDTVVFAVEGFGAPDTSRFPVALLIDQRTASSGETIVVSFRGRDNTRSFGDRTAGKSSANTTVTLADGSLLNITTSALYDRSGKAYGGPIAPDVAFNLPAPTRETAFPGEAGAVDSVLDAAVDWLAPVAAGAAAGAGATQGAPSDAKK
jgi:C-terminal processing protease CtpA/Prc